MRWNNVVLHVDAMYLPPTDAYWCTQSCCALPSMLGFGLGLGDLKMPGMHIPVEPAPNGKTWRCRPRTHQYHWTERQALLCAQNDWLGSGGRKATAEDYRALHMTGRR